MRSGSRVWSIIWRTTSISKRQSFAAVGLAAVRGLVQRHPEQVMTPASGWHRLSPIRSRPQPGLVQHLDRQGVGGPAGDAAARETADTSARGRRVRTVDVSVIVQPQPRSRRPRRTSPCAQDNGDGLRQPDRRRCHSGARDREGLCARRGHHHRLEPTGWIASIDPAFPTHTCTTERYGPGRTSASLQSACSIVPLNQREVMIELRATMPVRILAVDHRRRRVRTDREGGVAGTTKRKTGPSKKNAQCVLREQPPVNGALIACRWRLRHRPTRRPPFCRQIRPARWRAARAAMSKTSCCAGRSRVDRRTQQSNTYRKTKQQRPHAQPMARAFDPILALKGT